MFANIRLASERDSLRKSLQEALDKISAKEKDFARLTEDRLLLEKRIQQQQTSEENSKHTKSALDYELAKIKVKSTTTHCSSISLKNRQESILCYLRILKSVI